MARARTRVCSNDIAKVGASTVETARYSSTLRKRFEAKVLLDPETGCLNWIGAKRGPGYGNMTRGGRGQGNEGSHRVAWYLEHGSLPPAPYVLCHKCDNPGCCNVDHLFVGTMADNMQDMWTKGRQAGQLNPGERHPSAKMSDLNVEKLRAMALTVNNYAELGRRFGITKQHARSLVIGLKRPK